MATGKARKRKKAHGGSVHSEDRKLAVLSVSRIEGLTNTEKTGLLLSSLSFLLIRRRKVIK